MRDYRLHKLQVVNDDQAILLVAHHATRLGAQLDDGKTSRVVNIQLAVGKVAGSLDKLAPVPFGELTIAHARKRKARFRRQKASA